MIEGQKGEESGGSGRRWRWLAGGGGEARDLGDAARV